MKETDPDDLPEPSGLRFLKLMHRVANHVILEIVMFAIIILNLVPIIMGFVYYEGHEKYDQYEPFIRMSNFGFTVAYFLEAVIKVKRIKGMGFTNERKIANEYMAHFSFSFFMDISLFISQTKPINLH